MPKYASPDDEWRSILSGEDHSWQMGRRVLRAIPSSPRCKMCSSPFRGAGGSLMRIIGKYPWPKNPSFCAQCFDYMSQHAGGAEIPLSMLFADVRGSTTMAEGMSPTQFKALLDLFYRAASGVLVPTGAFLDKFVGDEVVALFVPGTAGPNHARKAIEAAVALLQATGHGRPEGPWIPIGAGVHTGEAYVGTVGAPGEVTDFTALGDPVNVTARLASAAAAGEVLVTLDAARAAEATGFPPLTGERRDLALKGKTETVAVRVVRVGRSDAGAAAS